ncbi:MAG TPA: hypothetical protein VE476_04725 [Propionibacteriaceae bacterium]|jgi:hypothetical protein|nr:hypothetical protein [Propionibacteriaceae bacterium]
MTDDIVLTQTLRTRGLNTDDIARLTRIGELARVRRGAYAYAQDGEQTPEMHHRRLVLATAPQLLDGSVVSHGSAAVLHGLPVWRTAIEKVHATCSRSGHGKRRSVVHVHGAPLPASDLTVVDGIVVTALARTVLDLGRTRPMEQAVAAGDAALRLGLSPAALHLGLLGMERWPGVRAARRTIDFLDGASESVGESVSRVRMHLDGLPTPELQQEILGPDGQVIARVDFLWRKQRVVGEFDGKMKYGRLLRPGQTVSDVVFDEKVREDRIRDEDHRVVRWIWPDLRQRWVLRDRVLRALDRRG